MTPLDSPSSALTAEHYQEQAIVAAALTWHRARTPSEVDAACDRLHAAVAEYMAPATDLLDVMFGGAR